MTAPAPAAGTPPLAGPAPAAADWTALLAPLPGDCPAGEWLRLDPVYDEIKLRRSEEDAALPQGVWQRERKRADWAGTAELCAEVLATRSKDLQVAAWLTEAWLQLDGFRGFERGVRLLGGLCRAFWAELHPPLDERDAEPRLAPLAWMAGRLPRRLKAVAVTAPTGEDAVPCSWTDWESGVYLANLARLDAAAAVQGAERGMVTQPRFLVSVSLTPGAWFVVLGVRTTAALAALDDLEAALAERCGEGAPSLTPLREPLGAIRAFALRVAEERRQQGELAEVAEEEVLNALNPATPSTLLTPLTPLTPLTTAPGDPSAAAATGSAAAPLPGAPGGPPGAAPSAGPPAAVAVTSRAQAYQQLGAAADYLMRTEPHSPVPYLVRRAVSWGNLSLAELLEELLAKNADLPTLYTLLGIKR